MLSIGNVKLGVGPRVAGVIVDGWDEGLLDTAIKEGADILELRIDHFRTLKKERLLEAIKGIRTRGLPLIATIRSREEGGKRAIDDEKRMDIFRKVIPLVDAVDIELGSKRILKEVIDLAHRMAKLVVVSYHNFKTTPGEKRLKAIIKRGKGVKGDIVKITTMVKDKRDLLRLIHITTNHKDLITLGMGRMGTITRVLFPILGSLITYGSVGTPSAPGQIPVATLKEQLQLYSVFKSPHPPF